MAVIGDNRSADTRSPAGTEVTQHTDGSLTTKEAR